jgi:hypothetical protein
MDHILKVENIIRNVGHFLNIRKRFSIKDNIENDLTFFLRELNRFREIAGIPLAAIDKVTNMQDGTRTVRFKTICNTCITGVSDKTKIQFNNISEEDFYKKIVKIFGGDCLYIEHNESVADFLKVGSGGNIGLKERLHLGSWSDNTAWYWKPIITSV